MKNIQTQLFSGEQSVLARMFKKLGGKISGIFEPEEVEVTFKSEGNKVSYTYTKVRHELVECCSCLCYRSHN
jgi:hypothetical protein